MASFPCLGSISVFAALSNKPVYLTFDTEHLGVAPLIAEVMQRQQVKVTFFATHEKTQEGDGTLGQHWATWWRGRAKAGHTFASLIWDMLLGTADFTQLYKATGMRYQVEQGLDYGLGFWAQQWQGVLRLMGRA